MWKVFDLNENLIARLDDLYEAELLAEAVGGRVELVIL